MESGVHPLLRDRCSKPSACPGLINKRCCTMLDPAMEDNQFANWSDADLFLPLPAAVFHNFVAHVDCYRHGYSIINHGCSTSWLSNRSMFSWGGALMNSIHWRVIRSMLVTRRPNAWASVRPFTFPGSPRTRSSRPCASQRLFPACRYCRRQRRMIGGCMAAYLNNVRQALHAARLSECGLLKCAMGSIEWIDERSSSRRCRF